MSSCQTGEVTVIPEFDPDNVYLTDCNVTDENIVSGEETTMEARVHNDNATTAELVVEFYVGGDMIRDESHSLDANSYLDVSVSFQPATGYHPCDIVVAQSGGDAVDSCEAGTVDVGEAFDPDAVYITDCEIENEEVMEGESVRAHVWVANDNSQDAEVSMNVYINGTHEDVMGPSTVTDREFRFSYGSQTYEPGTYEFEFEIDSVSPA